MARLDELRLMTKVARMYYDQGRLQSEIADQLDLSQATISRLLKRAEQEQIVRVVINPPLGAYPHFEEILQQRFHLKEAIVVDSGIDDDEAILRDLGSAAAFYLETTLQKNEIIGISSWSATLLAMLDALHPLRQPVGAQVIQLQGGVGNPEAEKHANHLCTRMAALLLGKASFLPAPGVVGSREAASVLLEDPYICQSVEMFKEVTLALIGIGALRPSSLLASSGNIFSPEELDLLRESNAVGDICLRFFDADGRAVISPLDERVIGIRLDELRRVRRAVGIAGGRRKQAAIQGALRGGWVNILITDRYTAERLVQEAPVE